MILPARFVDKFTIVDGCWLWKKPHHSGYGQFYFAKKDWQAHRFAYERVIGRIPDGLVLDHLCKNKACCNPLHVEPVTQKENVNRGSVSAAAKAMHARNRAAKQIV